MHVQLVGLVEHPHHQLGLPWVHQQRPKARLLDLLHDPIPTAQRLHRHRAPRSARPQIRADGARVVLDPLLPNPPALDLLPLGQRVVLVAVECDILFYSRLLSSVSSRHYIVAARAALSYLHPLTMQPHDGELLRIPEPWEGGPAEARQGQNVGSSGGTLQSPLNHPRCLHRVAPTNLITGGSGEGTTWGIRSRGSAAKQQKCGCSIPP